MIDNVEDEKPYPYDMKIIEFNYINIFFGIIDLTIEKNEINMVWNFSFKIKAEKWCKENCNGKWAFKKDFPDKIYFEKNEDATIFKLFWDMNNGKSNID